MLKNTMKLPAPPNNSTEFDHWYQSPIDTFGFGVTFTFRRMSKPWFRVGIPEPVVELGCGLGIFSCYVAVGRAYA